MNKARRLFKIVTVMACCVSMCFSACKKEEIPGPKGDPGEAGAGGNANISSTNVFQVVATQWSEDTVTNSMKATIDAPQITADVIATGAVKVFISTPGGAWTELPYVRGDLFTQFAFSEGKLFLQYINIEGGLTPAPAVDLYRMVVYSVSP